MGLVQKENLVVFLHRRASGNRETTAEEVENARVSGLKPAVNNEQRRKGKEQTSSSVPTGTGQTDVKSSTSLEPSPATGAKIHCCGEGRRGQDVKYRRVMFGILPCVVISSLETDAFMAIVACIDMLMVRRRKSELKEQLRFWVQGCVSQKLRSTEVHSAESWANEIERFGGTQHKILRTRMVRTSNSGRKRATSRRYPKRWTSWAKSLRAQIWGKNWGNLKTRRVCPQSSMGFGEKYKLKVEDKATFYSLVKIKGSGASLPKHRRAYVCGWFGSFNAHAEQRRIQAQKKWTPCGDPEPLRR